MSVIVTSFTEVLWIKFAYFDIRCTRRTCIGSSNLLFVFVHEHVFLSDYKFNFMGGFSIGVQLFFQALTYLNQ